MKEGQHAIYYVTATNKSDAERSPITAHLVNRGFEVLLRTTPLFSLSSKPESLSRLLRVHVNFYL